MASAAEVVGSAVTVADARFDEEGPESFRSSVDHLELVAIRLLVGALVDVAHGVH